MSLIAQIRQTLINKERSATEVAQEYLDRIDRLEPKLHSFVTVTPEVAIAQAKVIDAAIAAGEELPPLAGIPLGMKDNMCVKGMPTTCGSNMLRNFVPPYEATITTKLRDAGAVMVGKTNLDEFAMGSSTESSAIAQTANPWNTAYVPGGSSGGSAAAVASSECVIATGSDTGGSIRQPASYCGVVGLKPTYGLVSRFGLVAFASSLDQIGPFANTVEDAAIFLGAIAGYDPKDSTSIKTEIPDYAALLTPDLTQSLKGKRVGVITETFGEGLDSEVEAAVRKAIAHFESMGFGAEVKRRIMIGTYVLSAGYYDAYYLKAQKVRTLIVQDFQKAFEQVDVLVCPTAPTTAFQSGSKTEDPLGMYLSDLMTIPVNLAGLPGISIPCGFDSKGLPIGLQLVSNVLREDVLLQVAYGYEQSTEWHKRQPKI